MRIRRLLLTSLLTVALTAGALAPAASAGRGPNYCDPFTSCYCERAKLPKRKVRGMRKTPFDVCVGAMRALRRQKKLSPARACRGETTRRVVRIKRARRSPYALCVTAGKRLRRDL